MIILGRRLNGKPWLRTISTGGGGGGGTNPAPPALTGISVTQPQPIPAGVVESVAAKMIPLTFTPIGGAGPFVYQVVPNDVNGYTTIGSDGSRFDAQSDRGRIVVPYSTGSTNVITLQVTDATGATVTTAQPVTIDTSGGKGIYVGADRTWATNVNPFEIFIPVVLWTGSAVDTATPTLSDPSGFFAYGGGGLSLPFVSNFPPPGTYSMTLSASGYTSLAFAITIVAAVAGTPYFVQTLSPVSTSVLAGTVVGQIVCTTPNNAFTATLTDPSGTLGIDGHNVIIAQQPASAGSLSFSFSVTDGNTVNSVTCTSNSTATLAIAPGTTLPSSNMSFSGLTSAFTNDTFNNTIGTPTVTGVTGTKRWTLASQTGLNPLAISSPFGTSPARYQIDANTGAITAPAILSAGLASLDASGNPVLPSATDTLVVSCTDGINTCTSSLSITVNWAATTTYYVGAGMAAAHPGVGYERFVDYRVAWGTSDQAPHPGTHIVRIVANADPDYYTNDTGIVTSNYAARFPIPGPIIVLGVAGGGRSQPRMGGPSANNVAGGGDMRGKGFMVFGHGDAAVFNLEVSGCHDAQSDGIHGVEAIRKDGETYGNLAVAHNYIHDCDNGFLTGVCHGTFQAEYNLIENGGTAYVSGGATHNAYIGEMGKAIFRYNVSRRSNNGYHLKCRAMVSDIHDNRMFDGLSGSASACIDLPYAGQAAVYNNFLEKGPMALGPDTIRYAEEGIVWANNNLTLSNNTIAVLTLAGGHYGGPSVVGFFGGANSRGIPATATLANNAIYLVPGGSKVIAYNAASMANVTETGTTTLSRPVLLDTTRPDIPGSLPSTGPLYRHLSYGQDSFIHFDSAYHYQDRDQIQIASTTAPGTVICNIHAVNQLADQGIGTANPFGAGSTWSIVNDSTPYGAFTAWAASGKYTVAANADGSAVLKVGSTALTSGVDYVQVRATAPSGMISDSRYAIVAT